MNETELIKAMAADAGITIKQAKLALESMLANIQKELQKGNRVSIVGFGSWAVSRRNAREGRNPSTGQTIRIARKNIVKFKSGANLSTPVNSGPIKGLLGTHRHTGDTAGRDKIIGEKPNENKKIVNFSIMTPKKILAGSIFIVDVWAYLYSDLDKIKQLARELDREKTIGTKAGVSVDLGTIISIQLSIQHFKIEESSGCIQWNGAPTNASFVVKCQKKCKSANYQGSAELSVAGMKLCTIPFIMTVSQDLEDALPVKSSSRPKYIKKAFASYSSKDRAEVLARIQGMEKISPEVDIYQDVMKLRSGDDWEKKLHEHVPKQDVFYLFWSKSASESLWVKREWELALEKRGINYIDPIPMVDPRDAPAPKELSSLHFNNKYLAHIKYEQLRKV